MRSQVLPLLRNEIAKAARRKLTYFGLFAGALICGLTYVVADEISGADTGNAWGYVALSMQLVFTDIGLIFVLVFAALLMADETRSGTVRAMLAAPLYRWEFYLAKAVTGLLYMILMSTVSLALSMAFAKVHYHFGAVADSFGLVYSRTTVLGNFFLACVLSWIPLGAIVIYGLFISTVVRSPARCTLSTSPSTWSDWTLTSSPSTSATPGRYSSRSLRAWITGGSPSCGR